MSYIENYVSLKANVSAYSHNQLNLLTHWSKQNFAAIRGFGVTLTLKTLTEVSRSNFGVAFSSSYSSS